MNVRRCKFAMFVTAIFAVFGLLANPAPGRATTLADVSAPVAAAPAPSALVSVSTPASVPTSVPPLPAEATPPPDAEFIGTARDVAESRLAATAKAAREAAAMAAHQRAIALHARTYTVHPGDTLSGIATMHRTTVGHLMALNPRICNPDLIYPMWVIKIKGKAAHRCIVTPVAHRAVTTVHSAIRTYRHTDRGTHVTYRALVSTSSAAMTAVHYALAHLGDPYAWGGAGPGSFDCSGLTMAAYAAAGISIPHSAAAQYGYGAYVPSRSSLPATWCSSRPKARGPRTWPSTSATARS